MNYIDIDGEIEKRIKQLSQKMVKKRISKVLFVCSANVDRSPTAEHLFQHCTSLQVKSAGVASYAVKPLTSEMIEWADKVFAMDKKVQAKINLIVPNEGEKIEDLKIEDKYRRDTPELKQLIIERMEYILHK